MTSKLDISEDKIITLSSEEYKHLFDFADIGENTGEIAHTIDNHLTDIGVCAEEIINMQDNLRHRYNIVADYVDIIYNDCKEVESIAEGLVSKINEIYKKETDAYPTKEIKCELTCPEKKGESEEEIITLSREDYKGIQKLADIAKYTGGIAHNIKGKLFIIGLSAISMPKLRKKYKLEKKDKIMVARAQVISDACRNLKEIVQGMTCKIYNIHNTKTDTANINEIIESEMIFLEANMDYKHNTKKITSLQPMMPDIYGSPSDISQIISNLLSNAVESMYGKPLIDSTITIKTKYNPQANYVKLIVKDTGCGISEEDMEKMFEPNFTTKTDIDKHGRIGNGIGMDYVKNTLEENHGYIEINSKLGKYTQIKITFPAVKKGIK